MAIVASMNAVQSRGEDPGHTHPTTSVRNAAGIDNVRRRLSIIFQRPMTGMLSPAIHLKSCQSPRAQRC